MVAMFTRYTLRVTAKVILWKPEAVFSGISMYKLQPEGAEGITIVGQTHYLDSINIKEGMDVFMPRTQYQKLPTNVAVLEFLGQLQTDGFAPRRPRQRFYTCCCDAGMGMYCANIRYLSALKRPTRGETLALEALERLPMVWAPYLLP